MPPSMIAGMPSSAPATMPNATSTMSVASDGRSERADVLHGLGQASRRSDDGEHVAAVDRRGREHRERRPAAREPAQEHAPREIFAGELGEGAAVDGRLGDDDIERLGRNIEERPVVHLHESQPDLVHLRDQLLPSARDGEDVADLHGGRVIRLQDLVAAPHPLDEQARVGRGLLELPDPAPDERRSGLHGVGAILDVPPCGRDRHEPAAHLLLVPPAFLLEVDAHDAGPDLRQEPGGADDADQIRHGEGDRNAVDERGRVGGWQSQASDGVAGGADGRGLGERAGDDAGGGPGVIAEEPADHIGDEEARGRDDRRQDRLLQAVAPQPAEELRAGPEPDREQEQQEEALLDLARHLDAELADQHAGQQGPGDRAEREASQLHFAEQVAHPEDEEERDLGMVPQDADERLDHGRRPTVRQALRPPPVRPGRP